MPPELLATPISRLTASITWTTGHLGSARFTTLEPNLGVMEIGEDDPRRPTIADVPGLIEGASHGAGLGHAFLRHVERTRVLVHVVDGVGRIGVGNQLEAPPSYPFLADLLGQTLIDLGAAQFMTGSYTDAAPTFTPIPST